MCEAWEIPRKGGSWEPEVIHSRHFVIEDGNRREWVLSKSTIISTVMSRLSNRWFWTSWPTSCSYANLSLSWLRPMTTVSSSSHRLVHWRAAVLFREVGREYPPGQHRHSCGKPVLMILVRRLFPPSSCTAGRSGSWWSNGTMNWLSFWWRMSGLMVLQTKLKSTNGLLVHIPGWWRWRRMKCSPKLTASSANMFAHEANCRGHPISFKFSSWVSWSTLW